MTKTEIRRKVVEFVVHATASATIARSLSVTAVSENPLVKAVYYIGGFGIGMWVGNKASDAVNEWIDETIDAWQGNGQLN